MNPRHPRGGRRRSARRRERLPFRPIALALALWAPAAGLGAAEEEAPLELRKVERLYLDDVVPAPEGEEWTELFLRAETRFGEPVEHLRPVDLVIRDNGELVDPEDVQLSLLGEAGRGLGVVLVIDISRTMKGEPFERAKAASLAFLDRLGSLDRIALVTFGSQMERVASFDAARAQTRVAIEQLQVDEKSLSTVLYDGVHEALQAIRRSPALPRRSFVIVFSDGKDAGSVHTLEELIELARGGEDEPRIPVFSIGYARFGGDGLETLRRLSDETAAESFHATSTLHLASFFEEIRRQIVSSYVVRFPADMDGQSHVVEVTIEGQTDSRTVLYPDIGPGAWVWALGGGGLLLLAGGALWWLQGRAGGSARLVFLNGPRRGESVPIGRSARLGALQDNDVVVDSPTVSRYHARIDTRAGRSEIEDLGSRNGTWVNGSPVRKAALAPGDTIRVGDVDLEYHP